MRWFKKLKMPTDDYFHCRQVLGEFGGEYLLVDISALNSVELRDAHQKLREDDSLSDVEKFNMYECLQLEGLALSIRTNKGKIPFDATNLADLKSLLEYPEKNLKEAFNTIAVGSRLEFLYWEYLDKEYQQKLLDKNRQNSEDKAPKLELDEPESNPS